MPRALQGADGAGHRGCDIRMGAGDDTRGEGRGVEAVLRAHHEVRVNGSRRGLIRPLAPQLVQEAVGQAQLWIGLDWLRPIAQAREGRQCGRREGRDRTRLVHRRRPERSLHRSPRRDGGAQRVHGVGVRRQAPENLDNLGGQWRAGQVRIGAPFARPQELGDLRVGAALDELAYRIAAVLETTGLTIDHREGGLAGQHALQPGRIGALGGFHGCVESR